MWVVIYTNKLPLDPQLISVCEEFGIDSFLVAINGGLNITFNLPWTFLKRLKQARNFSIIGHDTREMEELHLVTRQT
jgi:thiamine-monophosphate kinase